MYVYRNDFVNLYGCLISLLKLGKIACPPNGAINIPTPSKKFLPVSGQRFVGMTSINEPGDVSLIKPQNITNNVIVIVDKIPSNEKTDNIGNGMNVNGVKMKKVIIFVVVGSLLNTPTNESLNKIINETPAPTKSIEKSRDMTSLAMDP